MSSDNEENWQTYSVHELYAWVQFWELLFFEKKKLKMYNVFIILSYMLFIDLE